MSILVKIILLAGALLPSFLLVLLYQLVDETSATASYWPFYLVYMLGLIFWIYYILHSVRNHQLGRRGRLLWVFMLVVLAPVGLILYWIIYVLPSPSS